MKTQKPIRVFFSPLSRRFYASQAWKQHANGIVTITGKSYDVTDDITALIAQHDIRFDEPQEPEPPQHQMFICR